MRGLANVNGSLLWVVEPLDQRHDRALAWLVHSLSGLKAPGPKMGLRKSWRNDGRLHELPQSPESLEILSSKL